MALDNFRTIELIWDKANKSIIKTIKTASSDTTGRYLSVKVLDGGQEVTLNNAKLQLYWEHPNFNTSGTDDFATANNGGLFKMTFSDEMLTNIGGLNAHLVLILTDGKITSDFFTIEVFKGADNGVVVPTNGSGLVEQVANKIDKGNVTMGDLTQEVKLAMTGGSVAIVGENAVGTENIKDGSITTDKLGFTASDLFNDFLLEYDTKNNGTIDKMYQVVSSEEFNIYLRLNKNEFVKYTFKTNGQENYIRLFDIVISEAGRNKEYSTHAYENPTVAVLGTSTNNHYITEIGGKVYLHFYGTGVEFNYYSRSNGGVWRPKIDGRIYPNISTYNANAIAKSTVIADDLPQTNHTLELEFIGADTNTVDAPRGWLIGGETFVVTSESDGVTMNDKAELTVTGSNKDFAFHVKPLDIEGAEQFFPLHSGNNTTNAVERKLLIDGNVIDMTSSTELTPFETGSFTEILESKMTYETGLRAKGKILWEFKEDRLSQELEYEFLKDSMVLNGYVFMLPVQKQYFDYLKTDKREIVNQRDAVIGVSTHFKDLNVETIRAYFVEPYNMYNLEVAIEKGSHDYQRLWLQRRDESISKLYPQPLSNTEFNVGDKLYFDGYFKVNNIF
ncbi:MAG TPA: hypothetical protein H9948_10885 [Candidatus Jeotgalibaca merdavium]|uniref:BppU N-terminal domain-containing protein n=1 Tax=Candidatus Jeotgalibaca merdavium TaxID=2838627 RepID=A0A9D2I1N3_9LACT|nr:hypothetical protein [Candidatus Jeotgalibaca merdavium]